MDPVALLPLLFWLVVGVLVGISAGRRMERKKNLRKIAEIERRVNRANIAAVPQDRTEYDSPPPMPWKATARTPSPYLVRNRMDPDKTVEFKRPDDPWQGFPTEPAK